MASAQIANSAWPIFMHDFQHTGQSAFAGPQDNTLHWKYQTTSEIEASPVLGTDTTIYVGDINGKFYAITPQGKTKWSYQTNGEIYAAAAIDSQGIIYVCSEDGYLYAIQNDGLLKWSFGTSASISSSPVIDPISATIYFCSEDKHIYAVDTNGNQKWKSELDEEIWASPALDVNSNTLYVGTIGGVFYAINASNGTILWHFDTGDFITGAASIDEENNAVLFGTGEGKIYALDKNPSGITGSLKWMYPAGNNTIGGITSTPAIDTITDADAIYAGSEDGTIYALDRTSGSLKWKYEEPGDAIISSPAIDKNGNVYFGSADNNIYSINKEGTQNWIYNAGDEVNSSPAIGPNGLLFIGSYNGNLYAIGSELTIPLTANFIAAPTTGELPLTVKFIDQSVGEIASWLWNFGDGSPTDASQNPSHTYSNIGDYTVSLTVTGSGDSGSITDTKIKENYISVSRKFSYITMDLSPSEITLGESLTITGQISASDQSEISLHNPVQVTLNFTNDEGTTDTGTATSTINGRFTFTDYSPPEGGSWTVTASWEGNSDYGGTESSPLPFAVNQAEITQFTIESSAPSINTDQTVDIAGSITLAPDNDITRSKFLEGSLKLIRFSPDLRYEKVIETHPYLSGNQLRYLFEDVTLPEAGIWELSTGYDKDSSFKGTSSAILNFEVQGVSKDVVGYAILVEGRVESKAGIDSHNLTANYIYHKLLERRFKEDDVHYLNFDTSQNGVDERPTEEGVLNAIMTWARKKMNESPAPLFIILVGHGDEKKFFISPDVLTAGELADAVHNLESQLISSAREEPVVIVLGSNRSGSFINALSKEGTKRIIITSSDTDEVSYKGPLPPDETTRQGDHFLYEFFKYASRNVSLNGCFKLAASEISLFTYAGTTTVNQHFDNTAQHPLLDDNGDGVGTYYNGLLYTLSGTDSVFSNGIKFGMGSTTSQLALTRVTDIVSLEAGTSTPELTARVNYPEKVGKIWIEIASPDHQLGNNPKATEQQVVNLPRFVSNDFTGEWYVWEDFSENGSFNNFQHSGNYEIFYFALDTTGEITPLAESDVIKRVADSDPSGTFTYISPLNDSGTSVSLVFDWEDSAGAVTYTFQISDDNNFTTIYYQQQGLQVSETVVDQTAGLRDGTTYYWRVFAINNGGVTLVTSTGDQSVAHRKVLNNNSRKETTIETYSSFTPKLANGYPGFVKGFIFASDTDAKISNATISVEGAKGSYDTTDSGAYFLELPSGTYNLSVDASGYETTTRSVRVNAMETTTENIGLTASTEPAGISGTVKDKKSSVSLEGVTVTIKKKSFTSTATSDSNGNFSFVDLASGKYKLTAEKDGYKKYKKEFKLKPGKGKTLNIKMSVKK